MALTYDPASFRHRPTPGAQRKDRTERYEREKMARLAEKQSSERKKVRASARYNARHSRCDKQLMALKLAEMGYGVMHILEQTGADARTVRMLVLGEDR